MKHITEYNTNVSNAELYHFLSQVIIQKDISDFSSLLTFCKHIPINSKTKPVFENLFVLIRKLNWGFFRDIDKRVYPKVWKEIVLQNEDFEYCGDLKRNLTISNIFVGILDLHGYTNFCNKHKHNLSMLRALDELIQVEMMRLACLRNVVLQRRHGDEIILVGSEATDLIELTLDIIDVFAKRKGEMIKHKSFLPDMHISAGIAGGNKFTPFIITLDGDLSGGVVNTASRLQSRANELSGGDRSRILICRTTYHSYLSENKNRPAPVQRDPELHFLDSGHISFKGVGVAVCEILFDEKDQYRIEVENEMLALMKAIDNDLWREGIFVALLMLLVRLYKFIPPFRIKGDPSDDGQDIKKEDLIVLARDTLRAFKEENHYSEAFFGLERLVRYSKQIPVFDPLTLEYAELITERYREIISDFSERLMQKTEELADTALSAKGRLVYDESKRALLIQERLNQEIRKHMSTADISKLWRSSISSFKDAPDLIIRSGKQ